MKDPALLKSLERIYHLETRSLLRYVYEISQPFAQTDWDRKLQALFEVWYVETRGHLATLQRLLEREDFTPAASHWPLTHSECNYLTYSHLLRLLRTRMRSLFDDIEAQAASLAGWPDAKASVRELLRGERAFLDQLDDLEKERPPEKAPPGIRRQVSANWW